MGRYIFLALMVFAAIVGIRQMNARTGSGEGGEAGASAAASEGVLIDFISRGEAVDIAAAIPKQGLVIVEFTADW